MKCKWDDIDLDKQSQAIARALGIARSNVKDSSRVFTPQSSTKGIYLIETVTPLLRQILSNYLDAKFHYLPYTFQNYKIVKQAVDGTIFRCYLGQKMVHQAFDLWVSTSILQLLSLILDQMVDTATYSQKHVLSWLGLVQWSEQDLSLENAAQEQRTALVCIARHIFNAIGMQNAYRN